MCSWSGRGRAWSPAPQLQPSLFLPAASLPCSTSNLVSPFLSRPERQCPGGSHSLTWSLPFSAPLLPTAFTTTGASSANRFVSIGSRDGNFLNIPQQSQVGAACTHAEVCTPGAHHGMRKEGGVLGRAVSYELHTQASAQPSTLPRQPQAPWLIS